MPESHDTVIPDATSAGGPLTGLRVIELAGLGPEVLFQDARCSA